MTEWTCPCGHEIDLASGECIVWDQHGREHRVKSEAAAVCTCHGIRVRDLEHRAWWAS